MRGNHELVENFQEKGKYMRLSSMNVTQKEISQTTFQGYLPLKVIIHFQF